MTRRRARAKYRRLCWYVRRHPEVGNAAGLYVERKGTRTNTETHSMDAPLSVQIRSAQSEIASPVAAARFRDAITVALLGPTAQHFGTLSSVTLYAGVDAIMAERAKRVEASLQELEAWAKRRLKYEGIALRASGDALAAALIQRFGGEVEIPRAELEDVSDVRKGISVVVDEDRGVVRFGLVDRPEVE